MSASQGPAARAEGPDWREECIPLDSIVKFGPFQVRGKLDDKAVKRYRDRTAVGQEPPPIKVGRVNGVPYLVDGWHRMEAGALVTTEDAFGTGATLVNVLMADMTEAEALWESAKANMDHGVPLKGADYRNVFRAFIKAGKHRPGRGKLMSYRDIAEVVGKGHTTIRGWMQKDFPRVAKQMGGGEQGNSKAGPPAVEVVSLSDEHRHEAIKAARSARQGLPMMTPQGRWEVAKELEAALEEARRLGVQEPQRETEDMEF